MQTPRTDISDENILQLLQNQSSAEHGFRLLMQKYQEQLYWVVRRMVQEHDDANDVIQNCFIKVFRSIHTFEGKSKLYTWLYRIATNEAITFLSQKKRKATNYIEDGELPLANQLRAEESVDGDALEQRLQEALQQLPEKQRLVFEMRYYDETPYEEMSELLDTSVGALKASYHHAVKKIETYFRAIEIGEL
ncbi:MAG: sigma-70 family RNA polymerase sigma factor [Saprospiraceae bacterium]|nr:sigma-70 family RNA polymerase sigma factor [Saprospiraceae bacterium]